MNEQQTVTIQRKVLECWEEALVQKLNEIYNRCLDASLNSVEKVKIKNKKRTRFF
jgi:hypothetical protein